MWSRVPDYLTEKLQEVEEEIEGEQQAEMVEEGDIPEVWESARERIDEFKEILHDLIDGKTHWLEADRDYGLLRLNGEIHEWYLDYQEELAQIIIARRFIADLGNVTERLKLLRAILLVGKASSASPGVPGGVRPLFPLWTIPVCHRVVSGGSRECPSTPPASLYPFCAAV